MTLNGKSENIQASARTLACLSRLRALRAQVESQQPKLPKLSQQPLQIVSENNFPTAAGLASSAAGFAALVRAVADLYQLPQTQKELSRIARQGSGSACRSLMGGYVAWRAGTASDGSDSMAEEVAPASHWPNMRAIVLVVSAVKKDIASTEGMQTTAKTSSLFKSRAEEIVPRRMHEIEKAIHSKDFPAFGEVTMKDSNSFHATCLDSWPPIHYLNNVSRGAMRVVENINSRAGTIICAYTFDAGPNAVIYYLEESTPEVAGVFRSILPDCEGWTGGSFGDAIKENSQGLEGLDQRAVDVLKEGVSRVICTGVGDGPVKSEHHLVSESGEIINF